MGESPQIHQTSPEQAVTSTKQRNNQNSFAIRQYLHDLTQSRQGHVGRVLGEHREGLWP